MTRRLWVIAAGGALLGALVAGVVVAARSGRDGSAAPSTAPPADSTVAAAATTLPATLAPGTLPPTAGTPATTARPTAPSTTATVAATTAAVAPTTTAARATSTPAGPTTTGRRGATSTTDPDAVPAFPCVPAGLLKAYAASQKVPAGATIGSVQCYGLFAGAVLTAPGVGSVFALFGPGPGAWQLLNAGSAYVCQPYEIPDPAYTVIGCPAWDR